jgi:hypothetical protein
MPTTDEDEDEDDNDRKEDGDGDNVNVNRHPITAMSHCSRGGYGVGRVQGRTGEGDEEGNEGNESTSGPMYVFLVLFLVLFANNCFRI